MIRLAAVAGFDPRVVARLPEPTRVWVGQVGALNLAAALFVGMGAGHVCALAFDTVPLSVVAGVLVGVFWLNILRLTIAAGALAPHLAPSELGRWRPPAAPLLFLFLFGVFFAQPVLALVTRGQLDAVADDAGLIARFGALWRHPFITVPATLLFAGVIAGGALVRALGPRAVRDYESLRHGDERAFILAAYEEHRRAVAAAYASSVGHPVFHEPAFEDPPFNQRPRKPGPRGNVMKATAEQLRRALGGAE